GNGTMRSWVRLGSDGHPVAIGVTTTAEGFDGWPAKPEGHPHFEDVLHLPAQAAETPFVHVGVSWMHRGHEPYGKYDVTHIDYHFFTISEDERAQITTIGDDTTRVFAKPCDDCTPRGYIDLHVASPGQGNHWANKDAPELHGQPFTQTFLY